MFNPLVSIIVRTKNEDFWIGKCLNEIFNQNYKNFEVILVDNNSTGKTVSIVKRNFPKVKIVNYKSKVFFPGKALNLGMNLNPMSFIIPRRISDNIPIRNSIFKLKINGNNLNVFTTELQLNNQNSINNYICSVAKTESLIVDSAKNNISNHGKSITHQSNVSCKAT